MIKNINKKAISLIMSGITLISIPTFTSWSKKQENGLYLISQDSNDFDNYKKTIIKDGKPVTVYSGDNIVITVDKETLDINEYICRSKSLSEIDDIYDLRTGEILVNKYKDVIEDYSYLSKNNFDKITDNKYIVPFTNIDDYIENNSLKKYYSLDEIEELESKIVDSIKLINGHQKVKEKSK